MTEPNVLKPGDPAHVPFDGYAKLLKNVGQSENVAELPLNEDDMSLLWYLLVSASMELDDKVSEADHYDFLLTHIDPEQVESLLDRIQDLEGITR
jgi:hypothetical protein